MNVEIKGLSRSKGCESDLELNGIKPHLLTSSLSQCNDQLSFLDAVSFLSFINS